MVVYLVQRWLEELTQSNYIFRFDKYCVYLVITDDNIHRPILFEIAVPKVKLRRLTNSKMY